MYSYIVEKTEYTVVTVFLKLNNTKEFAAIIYLTGNKIMNVKTKCLGQIDVKIYGILYKQYVFLIFFFFEKIFGQFLSINITEAVGD